MPIQRSRFQQLFRSSGRPKEERIVSVGPYAGIDKLSPPTAMSMKYSPDALNFEIDGGWLKLRTNLQRMPPEALNNGPLDSAKSWIVKGAVNHNGYTHVSFRTVTGSTSTLYVGAILDTDGFVFSSVKQAAGVFIDNVEQATSGLPVQMVVCADSQNDTSAGTWTKDSCFVLGAATPPAFFMMPADASMYADTSAFSLIPFTGHYSLSSRAVYGSAANERLVLYGLDNDNRVAWSVRGRPRDFSGEGAGFQDLSAQGIPRGIVSDGDRVVLATTDEIWEGRVREDAFAFDFKRLAIIGVPLRNTFVSTPFGPVWVGTNQQLYVLRGSDPVPIAAGVAKHIRERSGNVASRYMHAAYDAARRDFIIFWYDSSAGGSDGINSFFRINIERCLQGEDAWTVHRLAGTAGLGVTPVYSTNAGFATFNAIPGDEDGYLGVLYNASSASAGNTFTFSLADSPGAYASTYSEAGSRVQGYWTTPVIGRQDLEKETLAGVWLDYQSEKTSVVSILISTDGQSFTTVGSLTMTPTSYTTQSRPRSQFSTAYTPLTTQAYRTPQVRLVVSGDSPNTRIGPMRIHLKAYTGKF